jgi:membrane-associated phospholipid phosphatase
MTTEPRPAAVRWLYPAALIALASLWLVMFVYGGAAPDRDVYEALYAGHRPVLAAVARGVTFLGEPTVLVGGGFAVAGWLWWRRHHPHLALALMLVILIGRGLSEVQKFWIARPRPDLEPHLVVVKTSSFPSGHATSSMIFYVTLALALVPAGRWRRMAVGCAVLTSLLIGLSRVMLGVHWPSDVIGGWSFGLLWVLLTLERAKTLLGVPVTR